MNNVKVLLLAVNQWNFVDEKSGEPKKGTTVHAIHFGGVPNENVIGEKPVKYSLPYEYYGQFIGKELPAYADMEFTFDFGRGKMVPTNFSNITALKRDGALSGAGK